MARPILVADLLCGAGGSTTGCVQALLALGYTINDIVIACVNHWPVAIETHKANHPEARHYCQDISTVRPHVVVPEGYLDLLMASPTCTHHSVARGGKPTSDQQRSDPWHIITWFTELRVKRAIIENVWEYIGWGPVDLRTGKPIKSRKGEYFRAWVETIWKLGATSIEWRKLNAADYGDATTRQRFIMMIRFDGKSLSWPVPTHRKREDGKLELFPSVKPWRPARDIIDWQIKGRSIFNRKKPLAPKTLARIYSGAVKFNWPEPFLVILRNHMAGQSLNEPLPTIAANGTHTGLAQPVMLANRNNNAAKNPDDSPVPCLTTAHGGGIGLAEPVIVNMKGQSKASSVDDPIPTQTSHAAHVYVAEPMILGTGDGAARNADEPLPTITTGGAGTEGRPGCARPMLVEPFIISAAHGNDASERDPNYRRAKSIDAPLGAIHAGGGNFAVAEPLILNRHSAPRGETRPVSEPAPTPTTSGGGYLVEPFILSRQGGGAPRPTDEPTPTQCAKHSHVLISPYYGSGSGESCHSAEHPLPTVTAKARFGMVVPVTNGNGGPGPRSVDDPVPTMTTAKGGEFAIVMPVTHHDTSDRVRDISDPLPTLTGANRGELAFIAAQFGEREGQTPRVHDIEEPTPAICATGHINLIEATAHYDILFRMLEPHELAAAMGFTTEEAIYEFAGTKTEQIKQIGNAVSVAKMRACVGAIMADAAPRRKELPAAEAVRATARTS